MATSLTPPILTKGLFKVATPYMGAANVTDFARVDPGVIYTVQAIRTFQELQALGVDILARVYTPVGLKQADMDADVLVAANIITLSAVGRTPIYIPSTYITQFPDDSAIQYQYIVMSMSLGAVPSVIIDQLQQTQDVIKAAISDLIGIEPTIAIAVAPSTNAVTAEQYRLAEQNRLNAIKRRTTEHAQLLEANNTIAQLRTIIADYEARLTS
ncbi:hypothetical protein FDH97_gp149 [Erwinia phage vB_EamM_Deimos-Minion]|uniref:Uncharacterized protein n=1 Tax=Erwinia phage vB_EamM_Deimos-Minion TaxID=1815986 RepID=A0A173GF15_9CAUD|nr:hypothetical protein FDH97_gp149 [Erwinia phage vB_EamM_Deimos-Minion]ANH52247.1 hypothetical protein DM_149 [Erwinia phage vB_EamM_Deimos-Minion]